MLSFCVRVMWQTFNVTDQHFKSSRNSFFCWFQKSHIVNKQKENLFPSLGSVKQCYEVLHIFTQVELQLLYYRMTRVKVESIPFTFYSSESTKVHKNSLYFNIKSTKYILFSFLGLEFFGCCSNASSRLRNPFSKT